MIVELDKARHIYTMEGREAPGIHKVLGAVGMLDDMPRDQQALMRGQRIHTAIEYDIRWEGDFCTDDLTDYEKGCLSAARKARQELGLKISPNKVELLVGHRPLWYATQLDAIGEWKGERTVINWKTGQYYPYYKLQSAAEALCVSWPRRLAVFLFPNGDYVEHEYTDDEDFDRWVECCNLYNWQLKQGGGVRPQLPKTDFVRETAAVEGSTLFDLPGQPAEPKGIF